jgi:hypothetical protein
MLKVIEFAKNYKIDTEGNVFGFRGKMTPIVMKCGYLRVKLSCDDGKQRSFLVHRLVALTFIKNPDNKPQVNHKDGIKSNNNLSNLEWVTAGENQIHAYENELKMLPKGEINGRNILSEQEVISIYYELLQGARIVDVSKKYNVEKSTIASIKSKQNWTHVTAQLPDIPIKPKKETMSESTVRWICSQLQEGVGLSEIRKQCVNKNFSYDNLLDIKRRRNFKHIVKDYIW